MLLLTLYIILYMGSSFDLTKTVKTFVPSSKICSQGLNWLKNFDVIYVLRSKTGVYRTFEIENF